MATKKEIAELIKNPETYRIERTISTNDTDKFAEAICAFANDFPNTGKMGYLLIGVNDEGGLNGLKVTDHILRNLGGLRSDGNILPQPVMTIDSVSFPDGDVVVIEVQPSPFPPVRYKGRTYIRVGPRKGIASETEERTLIEKRASNATTFDMRPCIGASLKDLKIDLFSSFYLPKAIASEIRKTDNRDLKEQLASLRFYDLKYDCPTNAGILMFGVNPEYFMFGAYVQHVKFGGLTMGSEIINENKFTGDYVTILSKMDTFIETSVVQKRPVPVSVLREDIVRNYPYWAIRELVMNAVMHRDYESTTPTRFYEFENRLEIMNPGGLYGNANAQNFPTVNAYRNPVIAEAMKVLGYVNRFSRGVVRVQEELEENGNKKAVFDLSKLTVFEAVVTNAVEHAKKKWKTEGITPQVTHQVDESTPQVTHQVKLLLEALTEELGRTELQEKLGLKDRRNFNEHYLNPALEQGFIERTIPDKSKSRLQKYRRTEKGKITLLEDDSTSPTTPQVTHQVSDFTPQVTHQVKLLLEALTKELGRTDIQEKLGLKDKKNFNENYLNPALELGFIERTIPDKPNSRVQKYRITEKGKMTKNQY